MKTILLISSSILLLYSCIDAPNTEISEVLSDDEMKSRIEVEEISFEKDSKLDSLKAKNASNLEIKKVVDPLLGGCVLPKSELRGDSLPILPDVSDWRPPPDSNKMVLDFPEVSAQFPGGAVELRKFIQSNIKYPVGGACVQGRVYVSMIIEKDGAIREEQVMRGGITELNDEALRLIRSMPNWIPAQNNGKVVAARVRLPISFMLN